MESEFGRRQKHGRLMHHDRRGGMAADVQIETEVDIGSLGDGRPHQNGRQQGKNDAFHVCYSFCHAIGIRILVLWHKTSARNMPTPGTCSADLPEKTFFLPEGLPPPKSNRPATKENLTNL
jgi:hypothetical protein